MGDSISDEHVQSNIENALRAFAIYQEQKRYWSGFALHCMEIGVAFMHIFEKELNKKPNGCDADFLRQKSNISILTVDEIRNFCNGTVIPENLSELLEHFKKTSIQNDAKKKILQLSKQIGRLKSEKKNMFDKLEKNINKIENFEKHVVSQSDMWASLKASLNEKESTLLTMKDEMQAKIIEIQNAGDVSMQDILKKTLATLESIDKNLKTNIKNDVQTTKISDLELEIIKLKSEIEQLRSDFQTVELSDETKTFLNKLKKQINIVSNRELNDDEIVSFDDFDISLKIMLEEIKSTPTLQEYLGSFLSFLRFCCLFFHISNVIAKKEKSNCYDSAFLTKILSWLKGNTTFETFVAQLFGVNKKSELINFGKTWIKNKQDLDLNPVYSIALQFASVNDTQVVLKLKNDFPLKPTQMSCAMYDKRLIECREILLPLFVSHLISMLKHQKLDSKHVQILNDNFSVFFPHCKDTAPVDKFFHFFLKEEFFDVLPLHLFHQGIYLLKTDQKIFKLNFNNKVIDPSFFVTYLTKLSEIIRESNVTDDERKESIKIETENLISEIS